MKKKKLTAKLKFKNIDVEVITVLLNRRQASRLQLGDILVVPLYDENKNDISRLLTISHMKELKNREVECILKSKRAEFIYNI